MQASINGHHHGSEIICMSDSTFKSAKVVCKMDRQNTLRLLKRADKMEVPKGVQVRQGPVTNHVEAANEISSLVQEIGIPMVTALLFAGCGWYLVRYILTSIVAKITEAQSQTERDILELRTILIALIDKTTVAQSDLIRLDTMIRVRYGLAPDERRIGRNPDNKVK